MPDLGISVLLKGQNFIRMLAGLGVALKISLISVVISIPLGIVLGVLMTWKIQLPKRFFAFTWKLYESCHKWYCYFSYFSGQRERLAGTYQEKMHQL